MTQEAITATLAQYAIALFGLLMMLLSALMVVNPRAWSKGIISFSERPYFHPFEILTRLGFGLLFIKYSNQTLFPNLMLGLGYLLIAVGFGLLLTPPSKHKMFAVWSASKFENIFRPAGIFSFGFGAVLIYASLSK